MIIVISQFQSNSEDSNNEADEEIFCEDNGDDRLTDWLEDHLSTEWHIVPGGQSEFERQKKNATSTSM